MIIVSLLPGESFTELNTMDKVVHFGMYFIMAFLALAAFQSLWAKIIALIFTYGLGSVLEWGQGFVDDRSPSIEDNLANFLGATLGIAAFLLWRRMTSNRANKQLEKNG